MNAGMEEYDQSVEGIFPDYSLILRRILGRCQDLLIEGHVYVSPIAPMG
jgi:hypothetical protein